MRITGTSWLRAITVLVMVSAMFSLTNVGYADTPAKGGILNLTLNTDFKALDPAYAGDGQTIKAVQLTFAGLLKYKGSTRGDLMGNLAESWEWAKDGLSVTFKLRTGLKFNDGSPLTAQDVVFSFKRLLDPKTKAAYQRTYIAIKGAKDFIDGKSDKVPGLVVVDDQTIRFELEESVPYFLNLIGLPTAGIVSQKAVEQFGDTFGSEHPVGAGPFMLEKWDRGQQLILKRNPHYYREGMPYLDGVNVKLGVSENLEMMMFQKGEVDIVAPVSSADFPKVMSDPKLKEAYVSAPGPRIFYMGMNWEVPPFDKQDVRLAMNYAVNKQRLIQLVNGRGIPPKGIIPPWVPGYDDSIEPYPYDPQKAKELLAKAGYPNGFEVDFYVPVYFDNPKLATAIQGDLAKVGVKANIKQQAYPVFRETVRQKGQVPLFLLQWATDFPDPQNVLSLLFSCATRGRPNFTWHCNPDADKLIQEADVCPDPEKRIELYQEAQKIIWANPPWVFEFFGVADALKNLKVKPDNPMFYRLPTEYQHFDEIWKEK